MKFSFMRFVDEKIGMFLCSFLGKMVQLKNLLAPSNREIKPEDVKKILCQKYFGMGSILNAIPLIRALREQYPNAKIIFLTLESNREIIRECKIADEVLTISLDSLIPFIRQVGGKIFYLMYHKIDISIDLEFFSKFSMLMSFFTLARIRIGLHQKKIRPDGIITHTIYYNFYKHISEIYFAYASALGIKAKSEYFFSTLPSLRKSLEKNIYQKFDLKTDMPIVIININSSELCPFRCWPTDYFTELVELLIKNHPNYYYILIGGNSDREYVTEVYKRIGESEQLINAAGMTNIKELFALIEMSYLMITNDSGPMHIASLYSRNIASFFGPETPIVYGPLNDNALVFYADDMYCSPCLNVYDSKQSLYRETCVENRCLLKFTPKDVYLLIKRHFYEKDML